MGEAAENSLEYFERLADELADQKQQADEIYLEQRIEELLEEEAMNNRVLKTISHAIVVMYKKELAAETGILGTIFLCFGREEDAIGQVHLVKIGNRVSWRLPHVDIQIGGKTSKWPVFKGRLAEELEEWAANAYHLIKKTFGGAQYDHRYRVANGKVVDETPVKEASAGQ